MAKTRKHPVQEPVVPQSPNAGLVEHIHPAQPYEHEHPHEHEEHSHYHEHPSYKHSHEHEHPPHEHAPQKHEHRDLRGHLRGAIRGLLEVIETGSVNSEQRKAIHAVRVIIGDSHGTDCSHENVAYEEDDVLVCQDCRRVIAEAGG